MEQNSKSAINWFPGHMAKTRRLITECLPLIDLVFEVRDARIPKSSENPELRSIISGKPRVILFSKSSLADPAVSAEWSEALSSSEVECIFYDCITNTGISEIPKAARRLCADKLARYKEKGMSGRKLRAMIVGIPNVGKSSLINRLACEKRAAVQNKPGVTRDKQWITTNIGIDLLDTPGILWPKFEDRTTGENLALTGSVKDEILDADSLALTLVSRLRVICPSLLAARYKLDGETLSDGKSDEDIVFAVGKSRGFVVSGGEIDYSRTAKMLITEFRAGKIGRITLERPER